MARVMNGWVILVDQARDFPNADTPHKVITTGDYLARPKLFAGLGGRRSSICRGPTTTSPRAITRLYLPKRAAIG